jgi:hypothetical protein
MPYAFTISEDHRKAQNLVLLGDPSNGMRTTLQVETGIARTVLGNILPCDIGKRVYRTKSGTHQVENAEQMQRRLGNV